MKIRSLIAVGLLFVAADARAAHRRALLVGINDYTASTLPRQGPPALGRDDWRNLNGAVNDVGALTEMLVALHGFDRRDIATLTDQAATRAAIVQAIERELVAPAAKDDVVLFYFAGHGSQVRNSRSDERDQLDESIVPADARRGALDIRDKELRVLFNRILDRGAHLTVILDNCHSGSGARGLPSGAQARGVKADLRDVADGRDFGPRPEDRGALVLSAAEDVAEAWETRDAAGKFHGAFSWAWMRSMRDASSEEPAIETFLRAQARLRGETPFQEPVIAGNADARLTPFLGGRADRRGDRTVVAVQKVTKDGTVVLSGGWANGLSVGSELRDAGGRLKVTALHGLLGSEARVVAGAIRPGALLEVAGWAAPPSTPLRIYVPQTQSDLKALAAALRAKATRRGVRWIVDPTDVTPEHVLRWGAGGWELLRRDGRIEAIDPQAAVAKLARGTSLFVQLPIAASFAGDGVERVERPEEADYILAGRYARKAISYAWVRPAVQRADRRKSGLPLRSAWSATVPPLKEALQRLRKIHAWTTIESPPGARFPYRLDLRRVRDGQLPRGGVVLGGDAYEPVLRVATMPLPKQIPQRCVYVFVIDSAGRSTLLFPPRSAGSVENRFPTSPPDTEIALGESSRFAIAPPYGVDTYFLLTTDEPLPNPWILEWDGLGDSRSVSRLAPSAWSIERVAFESLPPQR